MIFGENVQESQKQKSPHFQHERREKIMTRVQCSQMGHTNTISDRSPIAIVGVCVRVYASLVDQCGKRIDINAPFINIL